MVDSTKSRKENEVMGYIYKFNGNDLVSVLKEEPMPVYPKMIYKYQGITKKEFQNFNDDEKSNFLKYIHKNFQDMTLNSLINEMGFEGVQKKNVSKMAIDIGFTNTRGRANEKQRDAFESFRLSGIVSKEEVKAPITVKLENVEPMITTVPVKSNIAKPSEDDSPSINYLELSGDIEENIMRIIDLGLKGNYSITIKAKR